MTESREYRPDINGLRAVAVVTVVLFHFGVPGGSGGFLGVDVFFVISGFLMTKIIVSGLEHDRFSIVQFWLARARRIVPALAALCAALLIFGWFAIDPVRYRDTAWHVVSSLTFISNFVFWGEAGYFASASAEKWLLHTWSLSVEWQFYLLYPIALWAVWRTMPSRLALTVFLAAVALASLALSVIVTQWKPDAAYFLLPTRGWELAGGGLAYLVALPRSRWAQTLGLLAIAVPTVVFSGQTPWPGYMALIPVVGTMLVIGANTRSIVLCNPVAQWLGNCSYSIYLWHWPVYVAWNFQQFSHGGGLVLALALTLVLAYLSYRYVETPLRKPWSVKTREILAYGAATAAIAGVAMGVYSLQGVPSRLVHSQLYALTAQAIGDWEFPGRNCNTRDDTIYCFHEGQGELVLFIGDSHVEQWYPRYGVSGSRPVLFVVRNACLPIRGVDSLVGRRRCAQYADVAWREVFERKPKTLVISSIWLTYFYDSSGAEKHNLCLMRDGRCEQPENIRATIFEQFARDVAQAKALGIRVVIVGPTPYTDLDYPRKKLTELAGTLPISIGRHSAVNSSYRIERHSYGREKIEGLLQDVARKTDAELVLPTRFMCGATCSYVDRNGAPIFIDQTHLRSSYVKSSDFSWLDRALAL